MFNLSEDLIFGSVYIPPENSRFLNNEDLNELENEINHFCSVNKFVILAGDKNSKTGNMTDFVTTDRFKH